MSFMEQYESVTLQPLKTIGDYLMSRGDLTEKLEDEAKSLDGCWSYIVSEAKKKAANQCACLTDEEVFGLAVHYYDESIDMSKVEKIKVKTVISQKASNPKKTKKEKKSDDEQLSLF
jgi:hypothetical protein